MADFLTGWESLPGNAAEYDVSHVSARSAVDGLTGARVLMLGSSVTWGYASGGQALGEYLAARFRMRVTKEAVNGTTLSGDGSDTYVSRLQRREETYDLVVVQLSTNDATQSRPVRAVLAALETIRAYVRRRWNAPVVVYTNTRYGSALYGRMVDAVLQANFPTIDLWHTLEPEHLELYMADAIHPTRAGYVRWWAPEVEKQLILKQERGELR
ncbi:hypothetical protein B9G54_05635 [Alloscardovia macacae]|uniref:SGNH/GDSL hydrolase family protein n=1 Tax=Alloscardovia macacae TaxID=1160091 RepID=UPI000A2DBCDB|nr:SGNH/GDSL hydrolase family protein [Alloscardovia macacae]OTA26163.1 hypothetical protein B9G54_05635 [Alloscardovia macacae]